MEPHEKEIRYSATNSYSVLNELTDQTRYVWVVLHGIGFLSRYFLRYFDELPSRDHYIIAPQAPAKYYLNGEYRHVGASWLTREATVRETGNGIAYLDAVMQNEALPPNKRLIVLGFSQGVSMAMRWVALRKIKCHKLVLYAGGVPNELTPADFAFMNGQDGEVLTIVGNQDEYLTETRRKKERQRIAELFGKKVRERVFKGGHVLKKELLNTIVP